MKIKISLLVALISMFVMASSALAFVETEYGTQHIESVYVTDMGDLVSGDVVVLKTSSPTYPGREVTGTAVANRRIFGVVLGDPDIDVCKTGGWIRVQTFGYCSTIKVDTRNSITGGAGAITVGDGLVTSGTMFRAKGNNACYAESTTASSGVYVTPNSVALTAVSQNQSTGTTSGYIGL